MKEIIPIIVELLVAIVTVILLPTIKDWLKSKLNEQQLRTLNIIVKASVDAFEQTIKGINQGPVRKEQVIDFVMNYCEDENIKLNEELLDILIEAVVKEMNDKKEKVKGE